MKEYTVYVHKNLKNDKYYVGSTSMNPSYRWNNGKGYQNNSKMWNDIQNSDWNSDWCHGILGKFDNKQDALNYEAFLIAILGSIENGYNTSEYGSGDFKRSEEYKKRISESMTGIVFTEEHKKKISESLTGKHLSEESRRKISEAMTGRVFSEEHKKKIRENNPSKPVLQFSKDGEFIAEYPSIMEASRQTGCYQGNICRCCMGKYKSTVGYVCRYAS